MNTHDIDAHDDHQPRGRLQTRRDVLKLLGSTGALFLAAAGLHRFGLSRATAQDSTALPDCVATPELTEGPYFVDEMLNRSDIRNDPVTGIVKEGTLLQLQFQVQDVTGGTCGPLPGAQVDVWHCDALGVYSDTQDPGFNTLGETWLRGYQVTDTNSLAEFVTIYPGWYQWRTVHIHFKIRTDPASESGYEFTSQLFFDDALTDIVYEQQPYASKGERTLRNDGDGIYAQAGDQLLLTVSEDGEGYSATFTIGLDLDDVEVGTADGEQNMGPGGGPPPARGIWSY